MVDVVAVDTSKLQMRLKNMRTVCDVEVIIQCSEGHLIASVISDSVSLLKTGTCHCGKDLEVTCRNVPN
jgi:hypothetical protein